MPGLAQALARVTVSPQHGEPIGPGILGSEGLLGNQAERSRHQSLTKLHSHAFLMSPQVTHGSRWV